MTKHDDHGQPPHWFRAKHVGDRAVDELLGICKGMLADGKVNSQEADFLARWLEENRELTDDWAIQQLDRRVRGMLADGVIDQEEREELFQILSEVVGGPPVMENVHSFATSLPVNNPAPEICFEDKCFCFTGKFALGTRKICEKEAQDRGAKIGKSITKKLDYLVIGTIGSRDWKHSTYGKKIATAIEYRDEKGVDIAIISEDHWASFLK